MEEFLYTREFSISKLSPQISKFEVISSKATADKEQLSKFSHLVSELEKNLIVNIPFKFAKR